MDTRLFINISEIKQGMMVQLTPTVIRLEQVNLWYDAPKEEVLIDRSKLKERAIILNKNNDAMRTAIKR